ncbi:MAG: recombinase family protein [Anaerolineae bacterium]
MLISENIPPSGPQRQMALTMLAAFAEYEKSTIDERTTLGRHRILREGKWPGGRAAYGYMVVGKELMIKEDEAEIVRLIFDLSVNQDIGEAKIAKILNDMGIQNCSVSRGYDWDPRVKDNKWSSSRIGGVLRNSIYKGKFVYGKTGTKMGRMTLDVPSIIDAELWERANARLKARIRHGRPAARPFLLKGLIRCGRCGAAVVGQNMLTHGPDYSYYRCNRQYRDNYGEPGCKSPFVRRDKLEDIVWNDIKWFVAHPGETLQLLDESAKLVDAEAQRLRDELANIDAILGQEAEERRRVTSLYREGLINDMEVREQLELLKEKQAQLNRRKLEVFETLHRAEETEKRRQNVEALLEDLQDRVENVDWESKRAIVKLLVDYIVLDAVEVKGKRKPRVTIHYYFPSFTNDAGGSDDQGQGGVGHLEGLAPHQQPGAEIELAQTRHRLRGLLMHEYVVEGMGRGRHLSSLSQHVVGTRGLL